MKKVLLISGILLTFVIGVYFYYYSDSQKSVLENSKSKQIINSNSLTMMYETEYQSGEYQVSTETTWPQEGYTFNEALSKCENGGVLTWDDENKKVLLQTNTSDKCYVYFDKEPNTLANYIINNVYTGTDGDNGLYYHDGIGSYTNADQEAGDNSYRYAGANPNNYVCFGSDEATCPSDNLYRIIGIFKNEVKLIRVNTLSRNFWYNNTLDDNNSDWTTSIMNTDLLNGTYYNDLTSIWNNKIENHTWQIGGGTADNLEYSNAQTAYNYEVGTNTSNTTYEAKIGLMYLSDYYYGANPTYWNYPGYTSSSHPNTDGNYGKEYDYRAAINDNWLHIKDQQWTISKNDNFSVYYISAYGEIFSDTTNVRPYAFRPCFYLKNEITYISGTGTQSDPYRIA